MKLFSKLVQSANVDLSRRASQVVRTLSTNNIFPGTYGKGNANTFESNDNYEHRIFAGINDNDSSSFFRKLDRAEKAYDRSEDLDGLDESFTTLSDGMEEKLKDTATSFNMADEEVNDEDYSFRPDMDVQIGMVLDTKDLDLRKPAVARPPKRVDFQTTTEEVLQNADFRNVRFLANFITEAGIMIKRSQTGISAKAQRKVAREIKTARAFGLLPFTTMGTKEFIYGRSMEHNDKDFEFETYNDDVDSSEFGHPTRP